MTIKVEKCTEDHLVALQAISRQTFDETFRNSNDPQQLALYLERAYDLHKLRREMQHPHTIFYFIYFKEELAGYIKLNTLDAQSEPMGDETLEIERIYLKQSFQGKGLGKALYNIALEQAKTLKMRNIWLGVWEQNEQAISFYKKLGFVKSGEHTFYMGDEKQIDWIMIKEI